MLVLTRKKNEKLILTDGNVYIEVMVVRVRGDQVQLGVTAPREVRVVRGEIWGDKEKPMKV